MTFDDMKGTPLNQPALDQRHRDQGWSAMHGGESRKCWNNERHFASQIGTFLSTYKKTSDFRIPLAITVSNGI